MMPCSHKQGVKSHMSNSNVYVWKWGRRCMERPLFEEPFSASVLFSCNVYAPKITGHIQEALTQTFLPFFPAYLFCSNHRNGNGVSYHKTKRYSEYRYTGWCPTIKNKSKTTWGRFNKILKKKERKIACTDNHTDHVVGVLWVIY